MPKPAYNYRTEQREDDYTPAGWQPPAATYITDEHGMHIRMYHCWLCRDSGFASVPPMPPTGTVWPEDLAEVGFDSNKWGSVFKSFCPLCRQESLFQYTALRRNEGKGRAFSEIELQWQRHWVEARQRAHEDFLQQVAEAGGSAAYREKYLMPRIAALRAGEKMMPKAAVAEDRSAEQVQADLAAIRARNYRKAEG